MVDRSVVSRPARDIAKLMSGTMAAQALTFAATPLLTRLYSQEAYGTLGVYTAVLNTASVLVTGKYELAIPLAKDDRSAAQILALCLSICLGSAALLLIPVLLAPTEISKALHNEGLAPWLRVLPVGLVLWGTYQTFGFWCNREGSFAPLAVSRFCRSAGTVVSAVMFSKVPGGAGGLILANLLGQMAAVYSIARSVFQKAPLDLESFQRAALLAQARKHRDLPLYQATTSLLDNYALAAPLLFVNWFGGLEAAGALNLVMLVLGTPVTLVSESVGQVLYQQASASCRSGQNLGQLVTRTTLLLSCFVVPGALAMTVAAPSLFQFIFGANWHVAGDFARWLAVAFGFRLIVSPLSLILPTVNRVRWGAAWKVLYACTTTAALFLGRANAHSMVVALLANDIVLYSVYWWVIQCAARHPSNTRH